MENQHQKIKGYRDLTEEEISLMNEIKQKAIEIDELFKKIEKAPNIDLRWLAIAKTDIQKGFMSWVRSVARPTTF